MQILVANGSKPDTIGIKDFGDRFVLEVIPKL
jgi:hypothetical protein